jgi:hypothetical protein
MGNEIYKQHGFIFLYVHDVVVYFATGLVKMIHHKKIYMFTNYSIFLFVCIP